MLRRFRNRKGRRNQRGVGLTEYVILVGVIGVGLLFTITNFKEELRTTLQGGQRQVKSGVTDNMNDQPRDDDRDRDRDRDRQPRDGT